MADNASRGQAGVPASATGKPVRVHVSFQFKDPLNAAAFAAMFRDEFIARSSAEPGCLLYDVWQPLDDPTRVVLIESWTTQQALDTHLAQDWIKEKLPRATALLGENNPPAFSFCNSVMD